VWLTLVLAFPLFPSKAQALPIFARRYGFSCQQCHTTVPTLNAFGRYFLRHGFRLPGAPSYGTAPLTVKVQDVYSSQGSSEDEPALPKAIVDEVELLSAGSLGRNASYYLEQYAVDGGVPGRSRDMWIDLAHPLSADSLGPALHVRAGEFTLPLPVDPETERPTLAGYALFSQTVGSNPFTLFDPRVGLDNYYTDDRHGVEAHFVVAQDHGVDLMGTFSKTIGSDVTAFVYRYQGRRALGSIEDRFTRDAYALDYRRGRFESTGLVQQGYDTNADGFGLGARSSGGFVQTAWHFSDALSLYARYDDTYDPFSQRQTSSVLSFIMRPARNMRFTLEGSRQNDRTYQLSAGLLFAY
jgi:hypothetical protein